MVKEFVEKMDKKVDDYEMINLETSTIKELDEYLDNVVLKTNSDIVGLAKEIGATDDQIKIFE